jgi:hypothetical protein
MNGAAKYRKYVPASAIMLVAWIASALAWWWWRSGAATGSDRINTALSYLSIAFWFPGWFIVGMFDNRQTQLATKTTDLLVPLLSGIVWGFLGLLVLKSSRLFVKFVHRNRDS